MNETDFCSGRSLAASEPLYGSAPQRRIWLLLEVNAPWGAQALAESDLPPDVRAHLEHYLAATPEAGILFIRQPVTHAGLRFFLAVGDAAAPALYQFTLESCEDLLAFDFAALADGQCPEQRDEQPLFLVCTHGKRDQCCALAGMPMFTALRERVGARAWRCSHIGGHRFAPTVLFLPQGLCYGRMPPDAAASVVDAHLAGRLEPRWLRGRCAWPAQVQAAAALLRQRNGLRDIDGLQLLEEQEVGEQRWVVTFRADGEPQQLRVQRRQGESVIRTSCVGDKAAAVMDWQLLQA